MNPTLARRAAAGGAGNANTRTAAVAAGSVWETRMLNDQVMGGIKLYADGDADEINREEEEDVGVNGEDGEQLGRPASAAASERRKRRSWRPPDTDGRKLSEILRGAPVPAERDAISVDKESDTPRRKTWVAEEIKQVDRVREAPSYPPSERKLPAPREAATDYPSVRHAGPETVKKSTTTVELEKEADYFCDRASNANNNRIQGIVDLLMWVDISRSAMVLGIGASLFFCSSYVQEINFSLVSGVSFLGLLNLAAVFMYKSIINREVDYGENEQKWWVGEEEAVRFTRSVLPYMNKLLSKLGIWFSGDPATTMKLAVILFILCRYGGQITLWTMAKTAFFGAFTIPRLCSSRTTPISTYAWFDRVRRIWDSCTHKKVVLATVFLLLWNFSSMAVRVWAGFMLVVVLRYYQQQQRRPWTQQSRSISGLSNDRPANHHHWKPQHPAGTGHAGMDPPRRPPSASSRQLVRR